eukprot:941664_1
MVNYLDLIIGNITKKLKANGQWNNTLIVFSADNGGEERLDETAANNYPFRGGKFVPFEGGIRVNSWVSGGYLPISRRGKIENGRLHICDWYSTFCDLAGLNPHDKRAEKAGLPAIDSLNMWPMISGMNKTSPRTEIAINANAFIQNEYKLLFGNIQYASWAGIQYPNTSSMANPVQNATLHCGSKGCLFDVVADMTEHVDIASQNADIVESMTKRLNELKQGFWQNTKSG